MLDRTEALIRRWIFRNWPVVTGEVTSTRVESVYAPGSVAKQPIVYVTYKFLAEKEGPFTAEDKWVPGVYDMAVVDNLKQIRPGTPVQVRYNPNNPASAHLEKGVLELLRRV